MPNYLTTSFARARPLSALLASLALFGCDLGKGSLGDDEGGTTTSGSESDSESDSDSSDTNDSETGDTSGFGGCGAETQTILVDGDAIPPGFEISPNGLLAVAEGSYAGTFDWGQNDGPVTLTYAGVSSPLVISVSDVGGEVRLTEVELVGEFPNGQLGGEPCSNKIEIAVSYTFVTEDGVFAETGSATLIAYSHAFEPGPKLEFELDFDTFDGSLGPADFQIEGGTFRDAILRVEFADDASTGSLLAEFDILGGVLAGGVASFAATKTAP